MNNAYQRIKNTITNLGLAGKIELMQCACFNHQFAGHDASGEALFVEKKVVEDDFLLGFNNRFFGLNQQQINGLNDHDLSLVILIGLLAISEES